MPTSRSDRFVRYAWGVLAYMVLVILWGAFVRATGSGAGCGSHWPLCNGEVIPRAPRLETLIELSHRLTSALAGFLVIGLTAWAYRLFPAGHRVRKGAVGSLVFVVTEGAIGAAIVLFEWVAADASLARTVSIALHLNNTFVLVAFLTLTAWWASGGPSVRWSGQGKVAWLLFALVAGTMLVSTAGAITALGDTLFRAASSAEALARTTDAAAHHLEQLRILHPLLAVGLGVAIIFSVHYVQAVRPSPGVNRLGHTLQLLVYTQLLLGFLNIWLKAPVWMQLGHLLVADLLWITLILFSGLALSIGSRRTTAERRPVPTA